MVKSEGVVGTSCELVIQNIYVMKMRRGVREYG